MCVVVEQIFYGGRLVSWYWKQVVICVNIKLYHLNQRKCLRSKYISLICLPEHCTCTQLRFFNYSQMTFRFSATITTMFKMWEHVFWTCLTLWCLKAYKGSPVYSSIFLWMSWTMLSCGVCPALNSIIFSSSNLSMRWRIRKILRI